MGFGPSARGEGVYAFLRFQRVDFRNLSQASACLYVNPQKHHTVLPEAAFRLPHANLVDGEMTWTEGENIADLLGWSRPTTEHASSKGEPKAGTNDYSCNGRATSIARPFGFGSGRSQWSLCT